MTQPLAAEHQWLEVLATVPHWQVPGKPLIIISPHPDDETLGTGGLIAGHRRRGLPVTVIAVTDGEAAYAGFPDLAAIRRIEQDTALEILGVRKRDTIRLGLPDSRVAEYEHQLANLLSKYIQSNTLVLSSWVHDRHPDHEACGRACERVARNAGAEFAYYLFWTWHQSEPSVLTDQNVRRFELDLATRNAKQSALECHRSQLQHESGSPILPDSLLAPARRSFETFIVQGHTRD